MTARPSARPARRTAKAPEVGTTGHEWDGIEELNNPLPRWWLWVFYATIVWGLWYTIAYPAWPLIQGTTLVFASFVVLCNLVIDIIYALIDPRIRFSRVAS